MSEHIDFKALVDSKKLKVGEKLYFVSDPSFHAKLKKDENGEYYFEHKNTYYNAYDLVTYWLGMEPAETPLQWIRTEYDQTLFELWQEYRSAA